MTENMYNEIYAYVKKMFSITKQKEAAEGDRQEDQGTASAE